MILVIGVYAALLSKKCHLMFLFNIMVQSFLLVPRFWLQRISVLPSRGENFGHVILEALSVAPLCLSVIRHLGVEATGGLKTWL